MGGVFGKQKPRKLLIVGLDNSGKSTIINFMKPRKEKNKDVQATVGFQTETFLWKKHNVKFTAFDMSGQGRYRNLWEYYYQDVEAIIFVIDASDMVRMCVVQDELNALLQHKDNKDRHSPILFLANKMDIQESASATEVAKMLELEVSMKDRPFHIIATNALTGQGIIEGMEWLAFRMK
jgi:ADP-ribosylation factor-like protein 6